LYGDILISLANSVFFPKR